MRPNAALCYIVLHHIVLQRLVLHRVILHYVTLYHIVLNAESVLTSTVLLGSHAAKHGVAL